jgi:hypothetical protein
MNDWFLLLHIISKYTSWNRVDDVLVSVLASSAVDRGFEPWSGQTKDYKIVICYFSAKAQFLIEKVAVKTQSIQSILR